MLSTFLLSIKLKIIIRNNIIKVINDRQGKLIIFIILLLQGELTTDREVNLPLYI